MALYKTSGLREDILGLTTTTTRCKRNSTDGFCVDLLDGLCRSVANCEGRREQLWLLGDVKTLQEGMKTQGKALLCVQQMMTWLIAFIPQRSSVAWERGEMLPGVWPGLH